MNPVVLVHGLLDTVAVFDTMTAYLAGHGWSVYRLDLVPNHGGERLETLAGQLATYIEELFDPGAPIDLVAFSMGGLVTRYYLQRLGGSDRVQRYINISAPNRGTLAAYGLPWRGIRQMRPGSDFIADLQRDCRESLREIETTTIWTPHDLMIVPAGSSRLGVGREVILPVLFHSWMPRDREVLATIREALLQPIPEDRSKETGLEKLASANSQAPREGSPFRGDQDSLSI
jgi:triacylglycerol lipase